MRPSGGREAGLLPAVSHPAVDAGRRRQRVVAWPGLALHTCLEGDRLSEPLSLDYLQVAGQVKRAFAGQQELELYRPSVRSRGAADAVAVDQPAVWWRTAIRVAELLVLDLDGVRQGQEARHTRLHRHADHFEVADVEVQPHGGGITCADP